MFKYIYTLFLLLIASMACGQQGESIKEEVYLHINEPNLLVGESLMFSAYVYDSDNLQLSQLSKFLYVELVDEKGSPVLQTRITLENGRGYGDFFLSSLLSTGAYQVIAYTRWMRNFENYFQTPIVIINPFEKWNASENDMKSSITFKPLNGKLVAGLNNKVAFRVAGFKDIFGFKGKVVDEAGDKILDFDFFKSTFGMFEFIPIEGSKYQAIIEGSDGRLSFYDLPKVSNIGMSIDISEQNDTFLIHLSTSGIEGVGYAELVSKKGVSNAIEIPLKGSFLLPKTLMFNGVNELRVFDADSKLIAKRNVFSFEISKEKVENKKVYRRREKIDKSIDLPQGEYSISIRKKSELDGSKIGLSMYSNIYAAMPELYQYKSELFYNGEKMDRKFLEIVSAFGSFQIDFERKTEVAFLPEYREGILEGVLEGKMGAVVGSVPIIYSVLGQNNYNASKTDSLGRFVIERPVSRESRDLYVCPIVDSLQNFNVDFMSEYLSSYPPNPASTLVLDSANILELSERGTRIQIENAYYENKVDSISEEFTHWVTLDEFDHQYFLDDYNRFPKLAEVFVEYIPAISVKSVKGVKSLKVNSIYSEMEILGNETLILLDGIPVRTNEILSFSPYKIKSVEIVARSIFMGSVIFNGLISFSTFDGDLQGFRLPEKIQVIQLSGTQPQKEYFSYVESNIANEHLPDFRDQLYWSPNVSVDTDSIHEFMFYTSDNFGLFELSIQGITSDGIAIDHIEIFSIDP